MKAVPTWLRSAIGVAVAVAAIVFFYRPNPEPDQPDAYGRLLQQAAQFDQNRAYSDEIQALQQAIALDSDRSEAYDRLGQAYLYGLNQLAPAEQAYRSSLAHSGSVTLQVMHDAAAGSLSISKDGAEYTAANSTDHSKMTRVEILGALSARGEAGFVPQGQFADAQRELALKILSSK